MMQTLNNTTPYIYKLYREVNSHIRYYSLKVYKTLFDEYVLEKEYGNIKNKAPTGVKRDYFKTLSSALIARTKKIQEKIKKGYSYART